MSSEIVARTYFHVTNKKIDRLNLGGPLDTTFNRAGAEREREARNSERPWRVGTRHPVGLIVVVRRGNGLYGQHR